MTADSHQITLVGGGQFPCRGDEPVLTAMERRGADHISIGCRGGGCGVCRVRVVEGKYRTGKMSAAKVSATDLRQGYALACRLYPLDNLLIEVS
ncbi:2Fe-2S iron-sulfur cluster-binding protein [Croceicoccus sp. Ery15]|uniref:2Fe-2S iron-sulfur cluster-binding protein n=1 Tax=Croceicoccus sp. Ery15 TaxID=1703338 RepID=UPI002102467A|nr:2Fe-2S iron-sulfur cluster-binding protein [Croceicoccus sp. Ery15]